MCMYFIIVKYKLTTNYNILECWDVQYLKIFKTEKKLKLNIHIRNYFSDRQKIRKLLTKFELIYLII